MEENTKQPNKKTIMISLILIIAIIAVAIYAYVATDLFKTPDQLFKKYLIDSVIGVSKFNTEPYTTAFERANNEPTQMTAKTDFKLTFETGDFFSREKEEYKISSTGTLKMNLPKENAALIVDIKNNEKDFFKLNLLATGDTYGVYIPELHDKYISVENRDLKKIAEALGADQETIDAIPNKIDDKDDKSDDMTDEEKNKLIALSLKYIDQAFKQIDADLYTKEDYITQDFDGEYLKGKKYILTISDVVLYNIILNTYKDLMQDQEFLAIIEKNIPENALKQLKELAETEELKESDSKGNIVITIFESDGKTIRMRIEIADEKKLEINLIHKENSSRMVAEYSVSKTEEDPVGYECVIDLANQYENNQGELTLQANITYNQNDISELKTKSFNSKFASIFLGEDDSENYNLQRYKNKNVTYKLTTTGRENDIQSKLTLKGVELAEEVSDLDISFYIRFDEKIEIPALEEKNTLVVNDYSKEDFDNLGKEISTNVTESMEKNPDSLIGSLLAPFAIINSISSPDIEVENQDEIENTIINTDSNEFVNDSTIQNSEDVIKQSIIAGKNLGEEIFNAAASQIDVEKALKPTEKEIEAYNGNFLEFEGEKRGSNVKALFSRVRNNADYANYLPTIVMEDQIIEYTGDIEKYKNDIMELRQQIEGRDYYNIEMFYDEIGMINKISIKKVNE